MSKIDPANRLLARQSRLRLDAEIIRDVALTASGLLSQKLGGPPVHPPQPEGIYVLTQTKKPWPEAHDENRYRRGMYTQFWRSLPHPLMPTFDAPDSNTSCTRRVRSNTPLQALTLANDRTFIELSEGLAVRLLTTGPDYDEGRLRELFLVALSRPPTDAETERLLTFVTEQRERFTADPHAAKSLLTASDRRPAPDRSRHLDGDRPRRAEPRRVHHPRVTSTPRRASLSFPSDPLVPKLRLGTHASKLCFANPVRCSI